MRLSKDVSKSILAQLNVARLETGNSTSGFEIRSFIIRAIVRCGAYVLKVVHVVTTVLYGLTSEKKCPIRLSKD
jgi:hypothetical protein